MKTAQEREALTGFTRRFVATFDRTELDEFRQGYSQAQQDFAFENRAPDVFALESIGRWSPDYARGYRAGRAFAHKIFSLLQARKGFPGEKGFSAVEHYGKR